MHPLTLTYFDFDGSRGEECRLTLHIAEVPFNDNRIKGSDWPALKADTPWGSMPTLELDGKMLGQSNAILSMVGRNHDLLPEDAWECARHEAVMAACEELRGKFTPIMREKDPELRVSRRQEAASGLLQTWGAHFQAQLGEGPFLGGEALSVADIKLYILTRWFVSGVLDHIPTTVFDGFPKLLAHYHAVDQHPGVRSWYALRAKA